MEKKKFLSIDGLLYFWNKIESKFTDLLSTKVDKVDGKGLSTNDLTDELKQKILDAGTGSFTGVYTDLVNKPKINQVEVNGEMTLEQLGIQSKGDYALKNELPSKFSDLVNDIDLLNRTETNSIINEAISRMTHYTFEKVDELPSVENANANVIYLVRSEGANNVLGDSFEEWILIDGAFELIGNTNIDLSGYVHKNDLIPITNEEIDNIFA